MRIFACSVLLFVLLECFHTQQLVQQPQQSLQQQKIQTENKISKSIDRKDEYDHDYPVLNFNSSTIDTKIKNIELFKNKKDKFNLIDKKNTIYKNNKKNNNKMKNEVSRYNPKRLPAIFIEKNNGYKALSTHPNSVLVEHYNVQENKDISGNKKIDKYQNKQNNYRDAKKKNSRENSIKNKTRKQLNVKREFHKRKYKYLKSGLRQPRVYNMKYKTFINQKNKQFENTKTKLNNPSLPFQSTKPKKQHVSWNSFLSTQDQTALTNKDINDNTRKVTNNNLKSTIHSNQKLDRPLTRNSSSINLTENKASVNRNRLDEAFKTNKKNEIKFSITDRRVRNNSKRRYFRRTKTRPWLRKFENSQYYGNNKDKFTRIQKERFNGRFSYGVSMGRKNGKTNAMKTNSSKTNGWSGKKKKKSKNRFVKSKNVDIIDRRSNRSSRSEGEELSAVKVLKERKTRMKELLLAKNKMNKRKSNFTKHKKRNEYLKTKMSPDGDKMSDLKNNGLLKKSIKKSNLMNNSEISKNSKKEVDKRLRKIYRQRRFKQYIKRKNDMRKKLKQAWIDKKDPNKNTKQNNFARNAFNVSIPNKGMKYERNIAKNDEGFTSVKRKHNVEINAHKTSTHTYESRNHKKYLKNVHKKDINNKLRINNNKINLNTYYNDHNERLFNNENVKNKRYFNQNNIVKEQNKKYLNRATNSNNLKSVNPYRRGYKEPSYGFNKTKKWEYKANKKSAKTASKHKFKKLSHNNRINHFKQYNRKGKDVKYGKEFKEGFKEGSNPHLKKWKNKNYVLGQNYIEKRFGKHKKVNKNKNKMKTKKPNIVFILTDDQDSHLGSLDAMPFLKRYLQQEGTTFTNAFSTTPMCCPSRSSILTGMYVHNHNTYTNNENCSSESWKSLYEPLNFGTYLKNAGYTTAFFGKYLNGYQGDYIPPGWKEWMGLIRNSRYYNYSVNHNGRINRHMQDYNKDYLTDLISNKSLSFFHKAKLQMADNPIAMVLSMPAPHGPEDSAPQYQHLFMNNTAHRTPSWNMAPNLDKQWLLQYLPEMSPLHQKFTDLLQTKRLQTLQSVDEAVERIYKLLKSLGELDNTYIIYSSDHGYHLGQYGVVKGKALPYEFDVKVPFIVRGPNVPKNKLSSNIVLSLDLAPTLLDIAGVNIPLQMDGMSILSILENHEQDENKNNGINNNINNDKVNKTNVKEINTVVNSEQYRFKESYRNKNSAFYNEGTKLRKKNEENFTNSKYNSSVFEGHDEKNYLGNMYNNKIYYSKNNSAYFNRKKKNRLRDDDIIKDRLRKAGIFPVSKSISSVKKKSQENIKKEAFWRHSFLIERGKLTPKNLRMFDRMEARYYRILARNKKMMKKKEERRKKKFVKKIENIFGKNWKRMGKREKKIRLQNECKKAEYQSPCKNAQEMYCKINAEGRLKVLKCGVFKQDWNIRREPLVTSADPFIVPLTYPTSSKELSSSSFSSLSPSFLSLSSNKCLCKKRLIRKKRNYEVNKNLKQKHLPTIKTKKRKGMEDNEIDGRMRKIVNTLEETELEIPCVIRLKSEETYIPLKELEKRFLIETENKYDKGNKKKPKNENDVFPFNYEIPFKNLFNNPNYNKKVTSKRFTYYSRRYENDMEKKNSSYEDAKKRKNYIKEDLFEIVCEPNTYTDSDLIMQQKQKIQKFLDFYKYIKPGRKQIKKILKEFNFKNPSFSNVFTNQPTYSSKSTNTYTSTSIRLNSKNNNPLSSYQTARTTQPTSKKLTMHHDNHNESLKNIVNLKKRSPQTFKPSSITEASFENSNNLCNTTKTNCNQINDLSSNSKNSHKTNLSLITTGHPNVYNIDKEAILDKGKVVSNKNEKEDNEGSDNSQESFYDYIVDSNNHEVKTDQENEVITEEDDQFEIVECDCDDEDVIKINGNNIDNKNKDLFSNNPHIFDNFDSNTSTDFVNNPEKHANNNETTSSNNINYKNIKNLFIKTFSNNTSKVPYERYTTLSSEVGKNPVFNENYYNSNTLKRVDYVLWHRRQNKKELKKFKNNMEKNIVNAMIGNRRNGLVRSHNNQKNIRKYRMKIHQRRERKRQFFKFSARNDPKCNIEGLECFRMDREHWKVSPKWEDEPICSCINANNNTYWCMRTINSTHNFLFCEFITGFMSYYDINTDPHQLRNAIEDLPFESIHHYHKQLKFLKNCRGSKECNAINNPDNYYQYINKHEDDEKEEDEDDDFGFGDVSLSFLSDDEFE